MEPLAPGSPAPAVPGVDFGEGPRALFLYKVTCPVCQMAAPKVQRLQEAYPGRIVGIGEDPDEELEAFGRRFGLSFASSPDLPPYELSNAYGIRTVPTTFLVGRDGIIVRTVESKAKPQPSRKRRLAAPAMLSRPSFFRSGGGC